MFEPDKPVRQQTQGPAREAGGGRATSQSDQVSFLVPVQLAFVAAGTAWLEGALQAFLDERLPGPIDGDQPEYDRNLMC